MASLVLCAGCVVVHLKSVHAGGLQVARRSTSVNVLSAARRGQVRARIPATGSFDTMPVYKLFVVKKQLALVHD